MHACVTFNNEQSQLLNLSWWVPYQSLDPRFLFPLHTQLPNFGMHILEILIIHENCIDKFQHILEYTDDTDDTVLIYLT